MDGLILVAAGAGGHAGMLSPFALVGEVRKIFDGPIALSGSIATGDAVLAAQAMGADFAYVGTRFIASQEAHASTEYKQSITSAAASDIVYTNLFTGVHGNYIRESISNSGLDPDNLPVADKTKMDFERQLQDQGVEGHLGRRPGRGPDRGHCHGRRDHRAHEGRVRRRARPARTGTIGRFSALHRPLRPPFAPDRLRTPRRRHPPAPLPRQRQRRAHAP